MNSNIGQLLLLLKLSYTRNHNLHNFTHELIATVGTVTRTHIFICKLTLFFLLLFLSLNLLFSLSLILFNTLLLSPHYVLAHVTGPRQAVNNSAGLIRQLWK